MNYQVALAHFPKITYRRYKKLIAFFGETKNIWRAEIDDLMKSGMKDEIANEFISWREDFDIPRMERILEAEKIKTISLGESNYPKLLSEISDPPFVIFYRGNLECINQPTLAVVGTRKFSSYGKYACQKIVGPLSAQGMTIVSGLAMGIDGIAHQTTLDNNGKTIAVLGSGINKQNISPSVHFKLSEQIIDSGGIVLSEYPPGTQPTRYTFPARNRIIAGLSLGTLVIEAAAVSGALITASCALDYNREVFTIPHNLTSGTGVGCNELIKKGAMTVTEPEDITNNLNLVNLKQIVDNRKQLPNDEIEEKILALLSNQPQHVDVLIKQTGLDSSTINGKLVLMEMKGIVKNLGGMNYIAS
jgi:DNA processing protein